MHKREKFVDIELKRTKFFKIIYAHYYRMVLLDDQRGKKGKQMLEIAETFVH